MCLGLITSKAEPKTRACVQVTHFGDAVPVKLLWAIVSFLSADPLKLHVEHTSDCLPETEEGRIYPLEFIVHHLGIALGVNSTGISSVDVHKNGRKASWEEAESSRAQASHWRLRREVGTARGWLLLKQLEPGGQLR